MYCDEERMDTFQYSSYWQIIQDILNFPLHFNKDLLKLQTELFNENYHNYYVNSEDKLGFKNEETGIIIELWIPRRRKIEGIKLSLPKNSCTKEDIDDYIGQGFDPERIAVPDYDNLLSEFDVDGRKIFSRETKNTREYICTCYELEKVRGTYVRYKNPADSIYKAFRAQNVIGHFVRRAGSFDRL